MSVSIWKDGKLAETTIGELTDGQRLVREWVGNWVFVEGITPPDHLAALAMMIDDALKKAAE